MGIKLDPISNTWTSSYSQRPGPRMAPISKTVRNISSEKEAKRVLGQIMAEVMEKAKCKVSPRWAAVVYKYLDHASVSGVLERTLENYRKILEAHTIPK